MTPELLAALATIAAALVAYVGHRVMRPKIHAEARRANAEAAGLEWSALRDEVNRLAKQVEAQGKKIAAMEQDRRDVALIADERERENRSLKAKLARLERRLSAIEALFKVHPITPELRADLDKLDNDN